MTNNRRRRRRMLPTPTKVLTPWGCGVVTSIKEPAITLVSLRDRGAIAYVQSSLLDFQLGTGVETFFGPGKIVSRRSSTDVATLSFEAGVTGYFQRHEVGPFDITSWINRNSFTVPTAEDIFAKFNGQVSLQQAEILASSAQRAFARIKEAAVQNATQITNLTSGAAQAAELARIVDVVKALELEEWTQLQTALQDGSASLKSIMRSSDVGKEAFELICRGHRLMGQLGNSPEAQKLLEDMDLLMREKHGAMAAALESKYSGLGKKESISSISRGTKTLLSSLELLISEGDPSSHSELARKYLPVVADKAVLLLKGGEQYLSSLSNSPRSAALLQRARGYLDEAEQSDLHSLRQKVGSLKLDELREWGEKFTAGEEDKQELLSQLKDRCLDFLLGVLPDLQVPAISSVKDDVHYTVSDLDLSGFKVDKKDVGIFLSTPNGNKPEVLTMTARNIHAVIPSLRWKFDKKKFPFAHGSGSATASLRGGAITLGFRVERSKRDGYSIPRLALASRQISIDEELTLTVDGSWFSAVYNVLASLFKDVIKDYIVQKLHETLMIHVSTLIKSLNKFLSTGATYWPLILRYTGMDILSLPESVTWKGSEDAEWREGDIETSIEGSASWLSLDQRHSEHAIIRRVCRPPAAAGVVSAEIFSRFKPGQRIVAINGLSVRELLREEIEDLLVKLPRPIFVRLSPPSSTKNLPEPEKEIEIVFEHALLGLRIQPLMLTSTGAQILGFSNAGQTDGEKFPCAAEGSGVKPGMVILSINKHPVTNLPFKSIMASLVATPRPTTIKFAAFHADRTFRFEQWPPGIEFRTVNGFVIINAIVPIPSQARASGLIGQGDIVMSVNGVAVLEPEVLPFAQVIEVIKKYKNAQEEVKIQFGVLSGDQTEISKAENDVETVLPSFSRTYDVIFPARRPLGITFAVQKTFGGVRVRGFCDSPSPARDLEGLEPGLALIAVNGTELSTSSQMEVDSFIASATYPWSITVRDLEACKSMGFQPEPNQPPRDASGTD